MNAANTQRRRLLDHVAEAMAIVVEFLWLEQTKDYLARSEEEQRKHIFNDLVTVRRWLQTYPPRKRRTYDE